MRVIKSLTGVIFSLLIVLPMVFFNFQSNVVSTIDNRKLNENPFSAEVRAAGGDLTQDIQDYVNDRIGFRDSMILAYTVLNDRVFGKMVHPSYVYGKNGYVFGAGLTTASSYQYSQFHEYFADMVKAIQDYCTERDVPFLFVFNPAKPAVLSEYTPAGTRYDRSWVDQFLAALDERQVRYIDNTVLLREKQAASEAVFNQKYDANHWNDLGAYYGSNAILEELKKDIPSIHVNIPEEMEFGQKLQTTLPVSKFPIHEMVPDISISMEVSSAKTELYSSEVELHPSYRGFGYFENQQRIQEGAPRALVFQGSYMNSYGNKFLKNGFGEYIHVHNYQNILNFEYYYNIFQPDCVIFEVAEYIFTNNYFNQDKMGSFRLNPLIRNAEKMKGICEVQTPDKGQIRVEAGEQLTKIYWDTEEVYDFVWMQLDREYDMRKTEGGYEITVLTSVYNDYQKQMEIVTYNETEIE